jgi:tetratricopeptide (TPR) repeat protein
MIRLPCPAGSAMALAALVLTACAIPRAGGPGVEPLRLEQVAGRGDAPRRASTRIVMQGLDADAAGRGEEALDDYQSALRVDPTNPWAYLALARQRAAGPQPRAALAALDQAEARLRAEGDLAPGVEAHLVGLRGFVLVASGDTDEGRRLLEEAARLAPGPWGDGRLDASELR